MKHKLKLTLLVSLILSIPLVVMQFTDEVRWTLFDFMAAGALLLGTGLLIELVYRKVKSKNYRILLIFAFIIILVLIWVELAVGVFGTFLSGS